MMESNPQKPTWKMWIFWCIVGIILALFLYDVRQLLVPLLLSIIFAYLLNPIVNYFESKGIKRVAVVSSIYIILVGIIIAGAFLGIPLLLDQMKNLQGNLPEYAETLKSSIREWQMKIATYYPPVGDKDIAEKSIHTIQTYISDLLEDAPNYLLNLFSTISIFVLIPFFAFYFLRDGKVIIQKIFDLLPNKYVETVLSLLCEIDEHLGRYIRGVMIDGICVGSMTIIGLFFLDVDYYFLIGTITGLGNAVPYLGPILGALIASLSAFIKFGSIDAVINVLILFAVIKIIDDYFIQIYTIGRSVHLHPLWMVFSVLAGAKVWGFLGMILAVPFATCLKVAIAIFVERYRFAKKGKYLEKLVLGAPHPIVT